MACTARAPALPCGRFQRRRGLVRDGVSGRAPSARSDAAAGPGSGAGRFAWAPPASTSPPSSSGWPGAASRRGRSTAATGPCRRRRAPLPALGRPGRRRRGGLGHDPRAARPIRRSPLRPVPARGRPARRPLRPAWQPFPHRPRLPGRLRAQRAGGAGRHGDRRGLRRGRIRQRRAHRPRLRGHHLLRASEPHHGAPRRARRGRGAGRERWARPASPPARTCTSSCACAARCSTRSPAFRLRPWTR